MNERLYFNGVLMDLEGRKVTRKIRIQEVGDLASRKSTFSYSVRIPFTAKNKTFFDLLGIPGNTSKKPNQKISVDYFLEGLQLIRGGYVIITETSEFYKVDIYDGIIDLSKKLGNKTLQDLELSDLDHFLTKENYLDSFSNTEGLIYAFADFGLGDSLTVKVEEKAPSIFKSTIFKKIFQSNGISVSGGFANNNIDFLEEVITPKNGYEIQPSSSLSQVSKGESDSNTISKNEVYNSYRSNVEELDLLSVSSPVDWSLSGGDMVFSSNGNYRFSVESTYQINANGSYSEPGAKTRLIVRVKQNGVVKSIYELPYINASTTNIFDTVLLVGSGDSISFELVEITEYPPEGANQNFYFIDYDYGATVVVSEQTGAQLVRASDYIGDMKQIDFLKDIFNRYGLQVNPIPESDNYEILTISDIISDREGAEEWSDKLVSVSENYISGFAKKNNFDYAYADGVKERSFEGSFITENQNAENERTVYKSNFKIPISNKSISGNPVYYLPLWEKNDDDELQLKSNDNAVMKISRVNVTVTASYLDYPGTVQQTGDIPFLSLDDCEMQYYVDNYYSEFRDMISDYKECDFVLRLSVMDIYNLRFFKLKYFAQLGRFFYLQSVRYTPGELSEVVMLEVLNF